MGIHEYFKGGAADVKGLGAWLDGLPAAERFAVVCELSAREQAALFDAARGARPLIIADFVPAVTPLMREVIHEGKNSLPFFSRFQKRFCRFDSAVAELWGYNKQP